MPKLNSDKKNRIKMCGSKNKFVYMILL